MEFGFLIERTLARGTLSFILENQSALQLTRTHTTGSTKPCADKFTFINSSKYFLLDTTKKSSEGSAIHSHLTTTGEHITE